MLSGLSAHPSKFYITPTSRRFTADGRFNVHRVYTRRIFCGDKISKPRSFSLEDEFLSQDNNSPSIDDDKQGAGTHRNGVPALLFFQAKEIRSQREWSPLNFLVCFPKKVLFPLPPRG
ncbi:hypothetical protein AVEN_165069-1 [Araneus ventricosus]|uniref:Uncharacterized protein n=1 Tax=Araneus ventricosus TaxID=182803 RepID=A0A4Y2F6I7_ARAVE|nr:hypothetical protein AVEN_165069-1 [Araneus ventricosus]